MPSDSSQISARQEKSNDCEEYVAEFKDPRYFYCNSMSLLTKYQNNSRPISGSLNGTDLSNRQGRNPILARYYPNAIQI